MDVLLYMVTTLAVFHVERSALNSAAEANAAGVYINAVDVAQRRKKRSEIVSEHGALIQVGKK